MKVYKNYLLILVAGGWVVSVLLLAGDRGNCKVGWGKMGQWGKMGHLHFRGSHCLPEGNFKLRRCMNVTPSYRQPLTLISSPQEVLIESKGQNNEDRWNAAFMRTK